MRMTGSIWPARSSQPGVAEPGRGPGGAFSA